jgi:hypothetical protein
MWSGEAPLCVAFTTSAKPCVALAPAAYAAGAMLCEEFVRSLPPRGLVMIAATFLFVSTHSGFTSPLGGETFSRRYMWCVAKYLIRPSSILLFIRLRAAKLSTMSVIGSLGSQMPEKLLTVHCLVSGSGRGKDLRCSGALRNKRLQLEAPSYGRPVQRGCPSSYALECLHIPCMICVRSHPGSYENNPLHTMDRLLHQL